MVPFLMCSILERRELFQEVPIRAFFSFTKDVSTSSLSLRPTFEHSFSRSSTGGRRLSSPS